MKPGKTVAKRGAVVAPQTTLRHVWLAGLGLAVLARRELLEVRARLGDKAGALHLRVIDLSGHARRHAQNGPDQSM